MERIGIVTVANTWIRRVSRRRSWGTESEVEIIVFIVILRGLRGHDLSQTLSGPLGGNILGALDGGIGTQSRLRMSRRHRRRGRSCAAGAATPLPGVDWTSRSPPIHFRLQNYAKRLCRSSKISRNFLGARFSRENNQRVERRNRG